MSLTLNIKDSQNSVDIQAKQRQNFPRQEENFPNAGPKVNNTDNLEDFKRTLAREILATTNEEDFAQNVLRIIEKRKEEERKKRDEERKSRDEENKKSTVFKILKITAYTIPLFILAIVYYINYFPFGYRDSLTLDVGNPNDTDTNSAFYIAGDGLGPRQQRNGEYFRVIDGSAYAVYQPKDILRDATIEVTWEGEELIYPEYPDIDSIKWDYEWDANNILDYFEIETQLFDYGDFQFGIHTENPNFSRPFAIFLEWEASEKEVLLEGDITLEQDARSITLKSDKSIITHVIDDFTIGKEFNATIGFDGEYIYLFVEQKLIEYKKIKGIRNVLTNDFYVFEFPEDRFEKKLKTENGCIYFDKTRLEFPDSRDMFEEGPWAVYVEWIPEKQQNQQQLIGHYNWEIWQNNSNLDFAIGDMELAGKTRHRLRKPMGEDDLMNQQNLLAIYKTVEDTFENNNGSIALFTQSLFRGRVNIGKDYIEKDYARNLTLGYSYHGRSPTFKGQICSIKFAYTQPIQNYKNSLEINISEDDEIIFALPTGKLHKLEINVIQ